MLVSTWGCCQADLKDRWERFDGSRPSLVAATAEVGCFCGHCSVSNEVCTPGAEHQDIEEECGSRRAAADGQFGHKLQGRGTTRQNNKLLYQRPSFE